MATKEKKKLFSILPQSHLILFSMWLKPWKSNY
jgi:hypothetical protein